jgi:hypothetical protein
VTIVFVAALIPIIMGFIWYNKAVMGKAWIKSTGLTEEYLKEANMIKVFAALIIFSIMLATGLYMAVIHQVHLGSLVADPKLQTPETMEAIEKVKSLTSGNYRTFGHGAVHGMLTALFMGLPFFGILALFERRSWQYYAIHIGYWVVCCILMGGIICKYGTV